MGFVLASARKDLIRRLKDPAALVVWIGIPFLILGLMTLAFGSGFGSGSSKVQAHLLLVDHDGSLVSNFFGGAFAQGQLAEMILLEKVDDEEQARARIDRGEGTALLVIPAGFGEAVLRSEPAVLRLWTNPAQRILPGIVEETVSVMVDGTFYLQQLLGTPMERIADGLEGGSEPALADVTQVSQDIYTLVQRIEKRVFPPAIEVVTEVITEDRTPQENLGFGNLFYPGMFFMAIFFIAQGLSDDIWTEQKNGTLHRALRIHGGGTGLLLGKIVAGAGLLAVLSGLSLALGAWLFGVAWPRLPLALAWSVVSGSTLLCMFLWLQLMARTQKAAVILGNLVMFPLLILGGSFFPSEAMPGVLAGIGRWTPNGWALAHLKRVFAGSAGIVETLPALAGMLALAALLVLWTRRRMSGHFSGGA